MGTKNYELMWAELKDKKSKEYINTYRKLREVEGFNYAPNPLKKVLYDLTKDLKEMDEMDGTNEFKELKQKMESED